MKRFSSIITIVLLLIFPMLLAAQDFDELNNQADKEYLAKNYQRAIDLTTQSINIKQNARAYFIRADARYSQNDFEAATDDYTSALSYYSSYYADDKYKGRIYYWRGLARYYLSKYNDAISDFTSAITYNYEDQGNVYWNRANNYYVLLKYKEADDDYAKAIDRISDSKDLSTLYRYRGDCKGRQADYTGAYSLYTRSINYNSDNYNAYWQRGYYKDLEGKKEDALADYSKTIEMIPNSNSVSKNTDIATLYTNQALIYKTLGRYDDALAAINKALQSDPNSINTYKTRAEIYSYQKKHDKARSDYGNAISLEKDKRNISDLYLSRSTEAISLLDYKGAMEDINKAIEINATEGLNYWNRSILYGDEKNYPLAIKDCDIALKMYKGDSSSTSGLSKLRASFKNRSGDYQGAVDDYQASLKLYPNDYRTYYDLGRVFKTKMKNNDLGDANLSKAANLAKEEFDTTMYCYIKIIKGEKEEAIKKALEKSEYSTEDKYQYPWDLYNIACIYALSGNTAKALEYLDKSFAAGYDSYAHLLTDMDLESITKLPQWKTILAKYKVPQPKL